MTTANPAAAGIANSLTTGRLPKWVPWALLGGSWVVMGIVFALVAIGHRRRVQHRRRRCCSARSCSTC